MSNSLKTAALLKKGWLAPFIVTCKLGLAVELGFFQLHVHTA